MARCMSVAVATILVAGIAGCSVTSQSATPTTTQVPDSSTETTTAGARSSTVSTTTAPTEVDTTTIAPPVTVTTVPPVSEPIGAPYDFWVPAPEEGAILGVVGVRYDDMLNVRSGPDTTFAVIATLEPTQMGIAGTGEGWQLPSGTVWWEIEADGEHGWVNQQFLSRLGGVDDLTSLVVNELGRIPVAQTMLDLGLIVATSFADEDNPSNVVVSVPPTVGDLGEITYDVVGLGDDSVGGYRLHIFGQPTDSGDGFSLMAVEAITMCQRAVSGGLCV